MAFLHNPSYPIPFFSEATLSITSRPIYMRLTEHHCLVHRPRMPIPRQTIGPFQDDGVQNAWFPGPLGSLRWDTFVDHQNDRRHIMLYTPDGHTAQYQTYNPETAGTDWSGYDHDRNSCTGCSTRTEIIEAAVLEERCAFNEEQRREAEKLFASVGLGRENTVAFQFGDPDTSIDGEDEEEDGDSDVMEEIEHDAIDVDLPPVRKTHDWIRNVVECDGVEDVMVTGAVSGVSTLPISILIFFLQTDDIHGQAWHHYTYYGRVRPWDGLIGILRVQRGFFQGTSILYGYISGGKNFSGNWRWALADPAMPAWECAVVMSKREE